MRTAGQGPRRRIGPSLADAMLRRAAGLRASRSAAAGTLQVPRWSSKERAHTVCRRSCGKSPADRSNAHAVWLAAAAELTVPAGGFAHDAKLQHEDFP